MTTKTKNVVFQSDTNLQIKSGQDDASSSAPEPTGSSSCPIQSAPPATDLRESLDLLDGPLLSVNSRTDIVVDMDTNGESKQQDCPGELTTQEGTTTAPEQTFEHKLIVEVAQNFIVSCPSLVEAGLRWFRKWSHCIFGD